MNKDQESATLDLIKTVMQGRVYNSTTGESYPMFADQHDEHVHEWHQHRWLERWSGVYAPKEGYRRGELVSYSVGGPRRPNGLKVAEDGLVHINLETASTDAYEKLNHMFRDRMIVPSSVHRRSAVVLAAGLTVSQRENEDQKDHDGDSMILRKNPKPIGRKIKTSAQNYIGLQRTRY